MRLKFLILFAVVCLTIFPAAAQSIDSDNGHIPMSMLAGPWRFHAGDDPSWSSATFDDSSWSLLVAGKSWSQQGYSAYSGVGWYRLRVTLPPHPGPLALHLPTWKQLPGLRQRIASAKPGLLRSVQFSIPHSR